MILVLPTVLLVALAAPFAAESAPEPDAPAMTASVGPHRVLFDRLEAWRLRRRFDLGPEGGEVAPGTTGFDAVKRSPWIAWGRGMVRGYRRPEVKNPFLGDGIEGERAALLIRVERAVPARIVLTFGDGASPRGPVDLWAGGMLAVSGVETAAGEFVDVDVQVTRPDSVLEIRLESPRCETFALAGVAVFGLGADPRPPQSGSTRVDTTPPSLLRADGDSLGRRAERRLRGICDYLLAEIPVEGGFSREGNWYECAYPVRALLAAARILDEPRYREAALACADRFVAERLPGAAWCAHYFGEPGCAIAERTRREGTSRNLADVGSMVLVLPLVAGEDPGRRDAYLRVARAYADSVVLPAQLEDGSFPDLNFEGVEYRYSYSVATGLQGGFLAALAGSTGDMRYLEAAERAGRSLTRDFEEGGVVRFHPYDRDSVLVLSPDRLGDLFYVLDGMLWMERGARPEMRREIRKALDRFFLAPEIRPRWAHPEEWLLEGSGWEVSKRAGLLYLLAAYAEEPNESGETLVEDLPREFAVIEDSVWAARLGVGAPPGSPRGRYALVASGMAGLGAASLAAPGSTFLLRN